MKKITLETLYMPWTLDTYHIFTFEYEYEHIVQDFNYDNETEYDYEDFEFTCDNDGYLKALADNLVYLLNENIIDDVILSVSYDGKVSIPRYYNFETDKAWIDFEVDEIKLRAYVDEHREQYEKEKLQSCSGFIWSGDEYETMLSWYLHEVSEKQHLDWESYYYAQIEDVCASEFVEYELIKK